MSEHPLPGYHFQVEWGGTRLGFAEVRVDVFRIELTTYDGDNPAQLKKALKRI